MTDTIETLDDLHDAMITRYPALGDRDRYAAIYVKMERQWLWFDALQREGQDRLAVMAKWLRLDQWGLDDANILAEIENEHLIQIEGVSDRYRQEREDVQRKFAATLEKMVQLSRDILENEEREMRDRIND